jgi:hypothetical protein
MKYVLFILYCIFLFNTGFSQVIYINPEQGNDSNIGSQQEPIKTLNEGVLRVNQYSGEYDSLVLKLQPGLYVLDENLTINYNSSFTNENTLTIEAEIMPDDEDWTPIKMPVLISTSLPESSTGEPCTYSLRVETNHSTIRGIKFLSNPDLTTKHFCILRISDTLLSLIVSQCMFIGDRDIMPVQVAVMVNGHGVEVEHCVFSGCEWGAIFFYAEGFSTPIKKSALHHCIITDGNWGAIWTSLVDSDFKFYNNIINNCHYFWIKNYYNTATYTIENSIVTDVDIYNGAWLESNQLGQGDYEFIENNVIRDGDIRLIKWDESKPFEIDRNFLHIVEDGFGYDFNAGIFKKKSNK